jgi:hypothetical protein
VPSDPALMLHVPGLQHSEAEHDSPGGLHAPVSAPVSIGESVAASSGASGPASDVVSPDDELSLLEHAMTVAMMSEEATRRRRKMRTIVLHFPHAAAA